MPEQKHLYDVNEYPKERLMTSHSSAFIPPPPAPVMTVTPVSGVTLNESKSNLALTKSESSSAGVDAGAGADASGGHASDAEKLSPVPSPPSFPEGGMQAWLTVLGG
jgi:hypothetical protein